MGVTDDPMRYLRITGWYKTQFLVCKRGRGCPPCLSAKLKQILLIYSRYGSVIFICYSVLQFSTHSFSDNSNMQRKKIDVQSLSSLIPMSITGTCSFLLMYHLKLACRSSILLLFFVNLQFAM